VTTKADEHLVKAREVLRVAHDLLKMEHAESAGRQSYIAGFHAALAFIAAKSDKAPKTHSSTRSEFARLAREEPRIDRLFTTFLAESYKLKTIADYGVELKDVVSLAEAEEAIATAERFVALIAELIGNEKRES
jgi:uncharacterized protein (UPF0332 family)